MPSFSLLLNRLQPKPDRLFILVEKGDYMDEETPQEEPKTEE